MGFGSQSQCQAHRVQRFTHTSRNSVRYTLPAAVPVWSKHLIRFCYDGYDHLQQLYGVFVESIKDAMIRAFWGGFFASYTLAL